jgi:hypothetical protein
VGKLKFLDHSSWFRSPAEPLIGGPPSYSCFEEFARVVLLKKSKTTPLQSLTLSLGVTSSKPQTAPSWPIGWRSSLPSPMAYRRVDPEPFLPPSFSATVVMHREVMARSVTRRLPPMHEDWAIINIQPLPEHEVIFPAVRDVVREYLVEHRWLGVRDIQRSHLGQVLVQFNRVLDRDNLVLLGPQQYLDATFTAQRHNDAWNHRALFFNRECWLMLLGFPLDYHSSEYLQAAIGSFGRLILWEEDRHNVNRTMLRVQVTSLEEVPSSLSFLKLMVSSVIRGLCNARSSNKTCWGVNPKMKTQCWWSLKMVSSFHSRSLVWANLCPLQVGTLISRQKIMFRFSRQTIFKGIGTSGLLMTHLLSNFSRTCHLTSSRSVIIFLACLQIFLLVPSRVLLCRMGIFWRT